MQKRLDSTCPPAVRQQLARVLRLNAEWESAYIKLARAQAWTAYENGRLMTLLRRLPVSPTVH